jgi:hypothetical protein
MPLPLKLKLDDDGKVKVEDGLPVYEFDDGSESAVDVSGSFKTYENKISNFDEERDRHSKKLKDKDKELKKFKGIDIEKYNKGMEKIKAIDDQKLLDESGAEALKKAMRANFDEELNEVRTSFKKSMDEKDESVSNLNSIVYDLAIKNKFATNNHFAGKDAITIYNAEDAAKIYGDHFNVETNGSSYKIVAKDHEGKPILSKKNHGEPATFDEAIKQIIDTAAKTKAILKNAKTGGPVTSSNLDTGDPNNTDNLSSKDKIKAGLKKHYSQHGRQM